VLALSADSGQELWTFQAGGPVDSPPTYHRGRVYFGCTDGWIYCLDAISGELAWRYRVGPQNTRILCRGHLESLWPVHGSVLVRDGIVCAAAGRSSFLDGGIYLVGLEASTGQLVNSNLLQGPPADLDSDKDAAYHMEGWLPDLLTSTKDRIYMGRAEFDTRLKLQPTRVPPDGSGDYGARLTGMRVFSTAGMLDNSCFDRTFWMHSRRWPGFYHATDTSKAGQLIVCDSHTTYTVRSHYKRNIHSTFFFAGTEGVQVFADDNDNEPFIAADQVKKNKHTTYARSKPPNWSVMLPIYVRAMIKSRESLFLGGAPDTLDPDDPLALFEGRAPGCLWALDPVSGRKKAQLDLPAMPVFDGLAATEGALYLSLNDHTLTCFTSKQ
jgi:hypothetical protein